MNWDNRWQRVRAAGWRWTTTPSGDKGWYHEPTNQWAPNQHIVFAYVTGNGLLPDWKPGQKRTPFIVELTLALREQETAWVQRYLWRTAVYIHKPVEPSWQPNAWEA